MHKPKMWTIQTTLHPYAVYD